MRGSQPGRRREKGNRFSKENQPKRGRGRPPGATNIKTRELTEAIFGGCADCGFDGKGTGGLRGYMKRLAMQEGKTMAGLLRAHLPSNVKVEVKEHNGDLTIDELKEQLARRGIPVDPVFKLEFYKGPLIEGEAVKSDEPDSSS